MIEEVDTGMAPISGPISNTVRAGGTIYMSQVPKDPKTGLIIPGDIALQARRALGNLKLSIEAAGGTLADVAQVIVFLIESGDMAGMNAAYAEFFKAPYPNRATVVVKELLAPGARIELVAHAHLGA